MESTKGEENVMHYSKLNKNTDNMKMKRTRKKMRKTRDAGVCGREEEKGER